MVLAGYKTVKEALVNYADEFGERDPLLIQYEINKNHGKEREKKTYPFLFNFQQMFIVFTHSQFLKKPKHVKTQGLYGPMVIHGER